MSRKRCTICRHASLQIYLGLGKNWVEHIFFLWPGHYLQKLHSIYEKYMSGGQISKSRFSCKTAVINNKFKIIKIQNFTSFFRKVWCLSYGHIFQCFMWTNVLEYPYGKPFDLWGPTCRSQWSRSSHVGKLYRGKQHTQNSLINCLWKICDAVKICQNHIIKSCHHLENDVKVKLFIWFEGLGKDNNLAYWKGTLIKNY